VSKRRELGNDLSIIARGRVHTSEGSEKANEWGRDRPGFGGTNVFIVAEAAALFAGEFTNDVSDAEHLIVKQMGAVEIERDGHEARIEFMDQGVWDD
jgi:hypothetical protein